MRVLFPLMVFGLLFAPAVSADEGEVDSIDWLRDTIVIKDPALRGEAAYRSYGISEKVVVHGYSGLTTERHRIQAGMRIYFRTTYASRNSEKPVIEQILIRGSPLDAVKDH